MSCLEVLQQLSGQEPLILFDVKLEHVEVISEMKNVARNIAIIHQNVTW